MPDTIALVRPVCRVRSLVRQDSNLVVHRIINDTIGIASHDRTLAPLRRHLAALPVTTSTRPHLASGIRHPASVIRSLPSVIRRLTFAIRLFALPIPRSEFLLPHFPKGFQRSHQLAVPGGLVAAVPLECRAAIQRRAVVPLGGLGGLDFLMLG